MSDINLSAGVRQNLLALQNTADLLTRTQERLATGNEVNSALDDPNAFFTGQALDARAADLSTLLDAQGQAIQVIEAADEAITAVTALVQQARALANQAIQTESLTDRQNFAEQYDDILTQIEQLAGDADFNGTNLLDSLNSQDLQVIFNEDGTSSITVQGVNYTDAAAGLGLSRVSTNGGGAAIAGVDASLDVSTTDFVAGQRATFTVGTESFDVDFTAFGAGNTAADQITAAATAAGVSITVPAGADNDSIGAALTSDAGDITIVNNGTQIGTTVGGAGGSTAFAPAFNLDLADNDSINAILTSIDAALGSLRAQATAFGTNLSTIQVRQDFTESLINTLETGADLLTLADTNEEGANLLTLQTRQQLASTSLSFATQADQAVLSLF